MGIVDVTVNLRDVERGFDAMERRKDTIATVFQALKRPARQDQDDHARRAMGPDGPWPRRSVATAIKADDRSAKVRLSRRRRKSFRRGTKVTITTTRIQKVRRLLGTLPTATRYSVRGGANAELVARSAVRNPAMAEAHNRGATVGRGARVPRREFLWWSDRFLEVMTDAIETHIVSGWDPHIRLARARLSL